MFIVLGPGQLVLQPGPLRPQRKGGDRRTGAVARGVAGVNVINIRFLVLFPFLLFLPTYFMK